MELFFGNVGYLITALSVFTIGACLYSKIDNALAISAVLGAFTAVAWIPSYWNDPSLIAQPHTLILMAALVSIQGKYSNRLVTVLFIALTADILWAYLQSSSTSILTLSVWHQSILNLLTITFSLIVLIRCYTNPTKEIGIGGGQIFYARTNYRLFGRMRRDL